MDAEKTFTFLGKLLQLLFLDLLGMIIKKWPKLVRADFVNDSLEKEGLR